MRRQHIDLRIGRMRVGLGISWLAIGPLILWAIATLYVPITAPTLSTTETWGVAGGITLLVMTSLVGHTLAHVWAAQTAGGHDNEPGMPSSINLLPFGDPAQTWPAATTPRREALVAMAGPIANLLIAAAAYLIWDRQLHPYLNVSAIFLAVTNAGLALVNLAPAFPLDGGRLVRAIMWGLLDEPARATDLGVWAGRAMAGLLAGWGVVLIAQRARFSLETGSVTVLIAGLMGTALWKQPAWKWDRPVPPRHPTPARSIRPQLAAGLLLLGLLGIAFSLVPTNNGLEAPGIAAAVEPMVSVPPEYRHPYTGSFILTTVFPQAPITAGQWVYGQLSPVVRIVPPERIVPPDKTPQELAEEGNKMLEESETIATVIALRLAGYDVKVELPFPVRIEPQKIAGGPSAGLMFTLTIYNLITPEDLTGGRRIAGTGTINLDGEVGPIGGVELKVAAAEGAGAEYFLVPPQNYADAQRVARRIKVVEVASAREAIEFLQNLPAIEDE